MWSSPAWCLGLNVGNSMWHSGTLAAAKQAVLLGIRGIAFSAPSIEKASDYEPIVPWLTRTLGELLEMPGAPLLNVNLPAEPHGVQWTRQSVRLCRTGDPPGPRWKRRVFWFAPTPRDGPEPGTDRHAIEDGLVSITPLRLDLTDEAMLARPPGL